MNLFRDNIVLLTEKGFTHNALAKFFNRDRSAVSYWTGHYKGSPDERMNDVYILFELVTGADPARGLLTDKELNKMAVAINMSQKVFVMNNCVYNHMESE